MKPNAARYRALGGGELVSVTLPRAEAAPRSFIWRGRRYRVRAVEPFGGHLQLPGAARRWICVRTDSGLRALLSQDRETSRWRMEAVLAGRGG